MAEVTALGVNDFAVDGAEVSFANRFAVSYARAGRKVYFTAEALVRTVAGRKQYGLTVLCAPGARWDDGALLSDDELAQARCALEAVNRARNGWLEIET